MYSHAAEPHLAGDVCEHAFEQGAVRVRLQRVQQPLGRHRRRRAIRHRISSRCGNRAAPFPDLCYRAGSPLCGGTFLNSTGWISANTWHANISYVTGSHNIKAGYNGLYDYDNQDSNYANSQGLVYQFNNGVPNQILGALGRVQEPVAYALRRLFRAGSMDAQPADAAGRRAVRARLQLLPGVVHRGHAFLPDVHDDSRGGRRRTSRTSCRVPAPRTTFSATARRR